MALLTKTEFSKLCGMASNGLSVYIKRGKVVLTGDHVDDSLPENREFIRKRQAKGKISLDNQDVPVKNPSEVVEKKIVTTSFSEDDDIITDEFGDVDTDGMNYQDLESLNKELDAKKKAEEIQILKIKKDKLHGIVVPTSPVKDLLARLTKSMVVEFSNSIDKIITKIAKRKALNNNEVAEIRAEVIEEINKASDKSIDETKKEVKSIIETFSEKRGKGERK